MKKKLLLATVFVAICMPSITAQFADEKPMFPNGKKGYEETYQRNIKKSRINGVYIPKDIEEAFAELDALSPEEAKAKFTNAPEDVIATKLHFGLGRWISVYWNFIEGSRYVEYLRQLGLTDPDHMIQFTIVSYHRYKNARPIDIDAQIANYKAIRAEYLEDYKKRQSIISTETRPIKKQ